MEIMNGQGISHTFAVLLMVGLLSLLSISKAMGRSKNAEALFITAELSNNNPYEGEAAVLTYMLWARSADIGFARRVDETSFFKDGEGYIAPLEIDNRGYRRTLDGETYFVFPLESYVVAADGKGSFRFKGGSFDVGVNYPVVYEDPFWGRRRGYKTDERRILIPELAFKVRSLPAPDIKNDETATVGNFTVSTLVPPGEIILEEPARAIITLKGRGLLGSEVLPQYAEAFKGENIKLKSMSEGRRTYYDGKSVVSELTLDCEFIPMEKEVVIGEVSFRFFNPTNGRYEKVSSSPVTVKVKSITSKVETVDI